MTNVIRLPDCHRVVLRMDPPELIRERQRIAGRWCAYATRPGGAFVDRVAVVSGVVMAWLHTGGEPVEAREMMPQNLGRV